MAVVWVVFSSLTILIFFSFTQGLGAVRELSEDDWEEMLEGEWLVKFYAPWCPACQSLTSTWEVIAERLKEFNVNVAGVDVTNNPALSGRFFVTALPTIFHIKDGVFRQFKEARSEPQIYNFVAKAKWQEVDPVPWYQSPTSIHMSFLGMFFRFSMAIRDLHSTMMTDYGIPVWGSYVIFAVATILLGLFIGLLIVCICDMREPTRVLPLKSSVNKKRDEPVRTDDNDNGDGSAKADDSDLPDENDEDISKSKSSKARDRSQSHDRGETAVRHREVKSGND